MKFTQANVRNLAIPKEKLDAKFPEHIIFDETMPGFGVRVLPGKNDIPHRTYIVQYKIGEKHRRMSLGNVAKVTLDDATRKARKIFGKVADGIDPAIDKAIAKKEASHTLKATIDKYLAVRKGEMKPRSYDGTELHLNTHWVPLHGMALTSIGRENVASTLRELSKKGRKRGGPVAANRARASLSAFFRWAIGEGLCDSNPVNGTSKQKENVPRERSLTDAEAAQIYLACDDSQYGRIVRLLVLTGCRRDEIGSLEWSELDLEAKILTLPETRTKNHTEHVVYLTDRAVKILTAIPRRERTHVFGSGKGGYSGWSKSKKGFPAKLKTPWTLHDLRRTVRTGLGNLGIAPHIVDAVLNHIPVRLIRTYDRSTYAAEKKEALEAWTGHLKAIISLSRPKGVSARAVPLEGEGAEPERPRAAFSERLRLVK